MFLLLLDNICVTMATNNSAISYKSALPGFLRLINLLSPHKAIKVYTVLCLHAMYTRLMLAECTKLLLF